MLSAVYSMLTSKTLSNKLECVVSPMVIIGPGSGKRYAIIDGIWLEADESVTYDLLQSRWSRPRRVIDPELNLNELRVEVKSSKGKGLYIVECKHNQWSCTCPSYGFRRGKCKHIDQVKSKKQ